MGPLPSRDAVLTAYVQSLIQFKARQLCRKPGFSRSDQDDLAQELTLRLLEKAHLYDPNRGASVDTFADRVVNSAVRMILRDRRRLKRAPGIGALSLDTTAVLVNSKPVLLSDMVQRSDRDRLTLTTQPESDDLRHISGAVNTLAEDLANIARRIMAGDTVAAIAREMGVSRRQIYSAIRQIRLHFQNSGLGDL